MPKKYQSGFKRYKPKGSKSYKQKSLYSWYKNRSAKKFQQLWRSPNLPVEFRRQINSSLIYVDNTGVMVAVDANGVATPWITLGSSSADAFGQLQNGFATQIKFNDLAQYGDFASLFNEWQPSKVQYDITLDSGDSAQYIGSGGTPGAQAPGPVSLFWYYDPNDNNPPTSMEEAQAHGDVKNQLVTNNNPVRIFQNIQPLIGFMPNLSAGPYPTANPATSRNFWHSFAAPNVDTLDFYGLHMFVRNFAGGFTGCRMRITPTFYFKCRRTR